MRTNIVIDDQLMREAMALTGLRTKREVVETALKRLVTARRRGDALDALWGSCPDWAGDIDDWRRADSPDGRDGEPG